MNLATLLPGFWYNQQQVNASRAIFHQWQMLEDSGCIENFRIAAGEVAGFREGFFFADSDAYKWLEAAARILPTSNDPRLAQLVDDFIALLGRAQMADGYIFTYNQIHFPGTRWKNLQVEHELYCHGHLIEAGVSHFEMTGRTDLLEIARKAADRISVDFSGKGPAFTPGHEEIEIALLRLHQVTGEACYFELARQFVEQRGRAPFFAFSIYRQSRNADLRGAYVQQKKQEYLATHPNFRPFQLPAHNQVKGLRHNRLRWYLSALQGKYFQQHIPIRQQNVPVGHTVRFAYLETAAAMIARATHDPSLLPPLERAWERMVTRRMYVTGGIGSLSWLEGFGKDYELDPEFAYAETCAALGSLFWNWEMAQLSGQARYSDLFEWQLYNAASPGMGAGGDTYHYNNPLASRGGKERQAWYSCPCCPSNLSRTWAWLGKYIYSAEPARLRVHQYISSEWQADGLHVQMKSKLPWQGKVHLEVLETPSDEVEILLRRPSWSGTVNAVINGQPVEVSGESSQPPMGEPTASGYDPRLAGWISLQWDWQAGDVLEIEFELPVRLHQAHPRVKGHAGKIAVSRGQLVFCLESIDNPGVDLFTAQLNPATIQPIFDSNLLGGTLTLSGKTTDGKALKFIPYFLWGNRGDSQMNVWINT